jgi:murein DD-endopeptidase MepM/ murein hydrolase activator NlpD
MAFDRIAEGGRVVLSQDFGQTAYAMSCRCEWTCPGYAPAAFHAGIDIASLGGEEPYLLAVGYGQCVKVGRVLAGYSCSGLGPYAPCIRSGNVDIWYGHARQSLVNVGDYVSPGQRIAIMDSVGCSTGNHVHYEVVPAGSDPNGCAALNPWPYILAWPGLAPAPAAGDAGSAALARNISATAPILIAAGIGALLLARSARAAS